MGGGLMQLVAYGAQDVFLTGNPQITFFKIVYRRHTNFAIESIEQTFSGTADFGRKVTCTIARSGDLITKMYLYVQLPAFSSDTNTQWAWVSKVGHALVDSVELEIGGTRIDKQYGDWLNVWYELARNWAQDKGYDKLVGNTVELTTLAQSHFEGDLYIPLQFFSNRHDGLAIPLIALQYHETKINIEFNPLDQCVNTCNNPNLQGLHMAYCSLFVDYIYLDSEERKRFAQHQHEYLIEQLQFPGPESVNSINQKLRLNFNHPCKAIYWNLQLNKYTSGMTFLAYDVHNMQQARVDATKRFVLACAKYTDNTYKVLDLSQNLIKVNPLISGSNPLLQVFQSINAVAITTDPDIDGISILGSLLSIEQFSTPVATLLDANFSGRPTVGPGSVSYDVKLHQWDNYGLFLDRTSNPVLSVLLTLNGHDRFSERDGSYFNYVQPYQHHSNTPTDGLNMYSFALNPEEHQPSGTCNFSRIDNAILSLKFGYDHYNDKSPVKYDTSFFANSNINVYATNYNVLRIMSGMGGLAYSN